MTWSKSADQMKAYYAGGQTGATQTVLGNWTEALSATRSNIGARSTTPDQIWNGYLAHCAIWNRALAPAEIAALAVV